MKIQNTLDLDSIYATLLDKILNFIHGTGHRYTDDWTASQYIKTWYPSWQFNGVAPFDDVIVWCEQHLGNNYIWNFETIYFKSQQDHAFFLLRWS